MDRTTRRGISMLLLGVAVLAYNVATGTPALRLVDLDGLFTASGAIDSPLLSYAFATVFIIVGAFSLLRHAV